MTLQSKEATWKRMPDEQVGLLDVTSNSFPNMSEDVDCSQVSVIPFIDKQSRELILFITFLPLILYHLFGVGRGEARLHVLMG